MTVTPLRLTSRYYEHTTNSLSVHAGRNISGDKRVKTRYLDRLINTINVLRLWSQSKGQPENEWLAHSVKFVIDNAIPTLENSNEGPSRVRVGLCKAMYRTPAIFKAWSDLAGSGGYPQEPAAALISNANVLWHGRFQLAK